MNYNIIHREGTLKTIILHTKTKHLTGERKRDIIHTKLPTAQRVLAIPRQQDCVLAMWYVAVNTY